MRNELFREIVPGSFRLYVLVTIKSAPLVFAISSSVFVVALHQAGYPWIEALVWGLSFSLILCGIFDALLISGLLLARRRLRVALTVTDCKLTVTAASLGHRPYRMLRCSLENCRWSINSIVPGRVAIGGTPTSGPRIHLDVPLKVLFIRFWIRIPCGYDANVGKEWSRLLNTRSKGSGTPRQAWLNYHDERNMNHKQTEM